MSRRSRLDIYFHVLEAINHGTHIPTRITYEVNVPWEVGNVVFDALTKSDFIREEKEGKFVRYYLEEKGRNALSYYVKALEGLAETTKLPNRLNPLIKQIFRKDTKNNVTI